MHLIKNAIFYYQTKRLLILKNDQHLNPIKIGLLKSILACEHGCSENDIKVFYVSFYSHFKARNQLMTGISKRLRLDYSMN
jgi:hypothetical protein